MNALSSGKVRRNPTDSVIQRSMELFGCTPEEKSDENLKWMLQNGYLKEKRYRRKIRGKRRKPGRT